MAAAAAAMYPYPGLIPPSSLPKPTPTHLHQPPHAFSMDRLLGHQVPSPASSGITPNTEHYLQRLQAPLFGAHGAASPFELYTTLRSLAPSAAAAAAMMPRPRLSPPSMDCSTPSQGSPRPSTPGSPPVPQPPPQSFKPVSLVARPS